MTKRYTPQQYRAQRNGSDAGAVAGAVGGAVGGYKGAKAVRGLKASKQAYHMQREVLGAGKARAAGNAVRIAPGLAHAAAKGPVKSLVPLAAGYAGLLVGSSVGGKKGRDIVRNRQDKVKKSLTTSAFGVDHG